MKPYYIKDFLINKRELLKISVKKNYWHPLKCTDIGQSTSSVNESASFHFKYGSVFSY